MKVQNLYESSRSV